MELRKFLRSRTACGNAAQDAAAATLVRRLLLGLGGTPVPPVPTECCKQASHSFGINVSNLDPLHFISFLYRNLESNHSLLTIRRRRYIISYQSTQSYWTRQASVHRLLEFKSFALPSAEKQTQQHLNIFVFCSRQV